MPELLFTCPKCEAHYQIAHLPQPVTECPVCGWREQVTNPPQKKRGFDTPFCPKP